MYWRRALQLTQWGGVAWQNLLIAQQRDQLRYAKVRGGSYLPPTRLLQPGMLVYLKTMQPSGLSLPAQPTILQVVTVSPHGVVTLQGSDGNQVKRHASHLAPCHMPNVSLIINRDLQLADDAQCCVSCQSPDRGDVMLLCDSCGNGYHTFCLQPPLSRVPAGTWVCPECTSSGVTTQQVERQQQVWQQQQQEAGQQAERLTPALQRALQLEGRWIRRHQPGARGWRGQVCYAQLQLQPPQPGQQPRLLAKYQGGQEEALTVHTCCHGKWYQLLEEGQQPPVGLAAVQPHLPGFEDLHQSPVARQPHQASVISWLQLNPWPLRSLHQKQDLQQLLPRALQPHLCHWASTVWLAPDLGSWLPTVKQQCWWSKASMLRRNGQPRPANSLPLIVTAQTCNVAPDLIDVHAAAADQVVLCILVPGLRQRSMAALSATTNVVVQVLEHSSVMPAAAVWVFPPWQQLHWGPAVTQLSLAAAIPSSRPHL